MPSDDATKVADEVKEAITDAAGTVPDDVRAMLDKVLERLDRLEQAATTPPVAANTVEEVAETAAESVEAIAEAAEEAVEAVGEAAVQVVETIIEPVAPVEEAVEQPVAEAVETVSEPVADVAEDIEQATDEIPKRLHVLFRPIGRR